MLKMKLGALLGFAVGWAVGTGKAKQFWEELQDKQASGSASASGPILARGCHGPSYPGGCCGFVSPRGGRPGESPRPSANKCWRSLRFGVECRGNAPFDRGRGLDHERMKGVPPSGPDFRQRASAEAPERRGRHGGVRAGCVSDRTGCSGIASSKITAGWPRSAPAACPAVASHSTISSRSPSSVW